MSGHTNHGWGLIKAGEVQLKPALQQLNGL